MKKLFFSFVMLVTLVIVAGSAKAQKNNTPYQGGTYNYSLDGIVVSTDGNAKIEYVGTAPTGWTIKDVNGGTGDYTIGSDISIAAAGGAKTLTFKIAYSATATQGKLRVTVTDGAATGCSNFIEFGITPQSKPDMTYAIISSVPDLCQNKNVSPLDDNVAATGSTAGNPDNTTAIDNSFTFTVTPVITNVTTAYSYTYTLALPTQAATGLTGYTITPAAGNHGSYNATTGVVQGTGTNGTDATPDVYTITFKTTTGLAPVAIQGIISAGSMTVTSGGATYNAATTSGGSLTKSVSVKTMPSIGTFAVE